MRRGVCLMFLAVAAASLGVGSARAAGTGTTTTATTTETTTATTTTPSYAPLPLSSISSGCVGGGAAAVVLPAHPIIALGAPGSSLGPSAYYTASGSDLSFDSLTARGSTCTSSHVTLDSVSLFGGVVSASSVQARDGKGTATGLEIDGSAVTAAAGETVPVEDWGRLTLGATVGRVTAPLVLRLLQAHDSLPAGAVVAVGYAVAARPTAKPAQAHVAHGHASATSRPQKPVARTHRLSSRKLRRRHALRLRLSAGETLASAVPKTPYPFAVGGGLGRALRSNRILSITMRYLGIRYKWAGARPATGFDCSGLVQYVFAQLGIALPHNANAQWESPDALPVPLKRLRAGDLVFFVGSDGTRKAPGHVGIYIGDGYLIDAPHTGSFVRIDSLRERWFAAKYVGARRIVRTPFDTRSLLVVPQAASGPPLPRSVPEQIAAQAPATPVRRLAAVRGAVHTTTSTSDVSLTAFSLAGGLPFLLLAGAAVQRRRRAPEAAASPAID